MIETTEDTIASTDESMITDRESINGLSSSEDENDVKNVNNTTQKKIEEANEAPAELTVVMDKSHVQRDFTHYFAMFCWIGWTFFYFILTFSSPFLYSYAPSFFNIVFALIFLSAVLPNDLKKQPQVTHILSFSTFLIFLYYIIVGNRLWRLANGQSRGVFPFESDSGRSSSD